MFMDLIEVQFINQTDCMLINRTTERHFFPLAVICGIIISGAELVEQTELRIIPFTKIMASSISPNIFAIHCPDIFLERNTVFE